MLAAPPHPSPPAALSPEASASVCKWSHTCGLRGVPSPARRPVFKAHPCGGVSTPFLVLPDDVLSCGRKRSTRSPAGGHLGRVHFRAVVNLRIQGFVWPYVMICQEVDT